MLKQHRQLRRDAELCHWSFSIDLRWLDQPLAMGLKTYRNLPIRLVQQVEPP
jgi:hypothetical protein